MPIQKHARYGWTNAGREVIGFGGAYFVRGPKRSEQVTLTVAVEMLTAPWAQWEPGGDPAFDAAVQTRLAARGMVVLDTGRNWYADDLAVPETVAS